MAKNLMEQAVEECPLTVNNKDKSCSYRWVREGRVEEMTKKGWVVDQRKAPEKDKSSKTPEDGTPVGQTHENDGSAKRYMDLVLMKTSVVNHNAAKKRQSEKARRTLESIQENYKEEAKKGGMKPLIDVKIE